MRLLAILWIFSLLQISQTLRAQANCYSFDTLHAGTVKLETIDMQYGNTYRFQDIISIDTILFVMPASLPRGYYEAYYEEDSNKMALAYYNFGRPSYMQQFYKDGSIKSDTEYDAYGNMHGLHVVYDQVGNELWHVDYYHGQAEEKYTLNYLEAFNFTRELVTSDKAWGCYAFSPTPMREREDRFFLKADGTFSYYNFKANRENHKSVQGNWSLQGDLLKLQIEEGGLWPSSTKFFALILSPGIKRRFMIEVLPWGLHWYASEYHFKRKKKDPHR